MSNETILKHVPPVRRDDEPAVASAKKRSGPIPGGRSVDRVIKCKERRGGMAFTLRVHFDFDKSSDGDHERLKRALKKLERLV